MPYQAYYNLPEEKRQRIRRAVLELFASLPYKEVTTRKIVQQSGISMGSLYQYFESKDEMYLYFIDEVAYGAVNLISGTLPESWSKDSLSSLERSFIDSMYRVPSSVLEKYYFSRERVAFSANVRRFSRLQREAKLPPNVDPELLACLSLGQAFSLILYVRSLGFTTPEEIESFIDSKLETIHYFQPEALLMEEFKKK